MGAEVRAVLRPILKDVFKSYFRALPETRTFKIGAETVQAHGYRLAIMMNAGGRYNSAQWMHANFEWWLAPSTPADEIAGTFGAKSMVAMRELHGPTTSMWMNEMLPVMWQMLPQSLHQALATLTPQGALLNATTFASSGAPVYAAMTFSPPKNEEKSDDTGTIRVELQMTARDTRVLGKAIFEAPPEYEKESLEPILKDYEDGIKDLQNLFDEETRLSDAGGANPKSPKYSFSALREYLRAAQSFSH